MTATPAPAPDAGLDRANPLDAAVRRFDALVVAGADRVDRFAAGCDLLAVAAATGLGDWHAILQPNRQHEIEAACASPEDRLDMLELLVFAPEATGLPAEARARVEEIGHRHAADPETARAAERLLHLLGVPDAAYRVERSRKDAARGRRGRGHGPQPIRTERGLTGLAVLVAGGHPALRARVESDLRRSGSGEVRELPAAWEATRRERDVRALVAGVDVAVLIGRQIAHSTVEQVKAAAEAAGVPVVVAETASAGAVRRALSRHLSDRDLDGEGRGDPRRTP